MEAVQRALAIESPAGALGGRVGPLRATIALITLACWLQAALAAQTVSPCGDFYGYVNRDWLARTTIPDDRSSWGAYHEIEQRIEKLILDGLETGLKGPLPPEGTTRRKLLDFFASGIDTAAIERAGLAPLEDLFERIDALASRAELADVLARMHRIGIAAGFSLDVGIDPGDSARYVPVFAQGGIGLPDRDFYLAADAASRRLRAQYRQHVARVFELLGEAPPRARLSAQRVMSFETRLARASMTQVERRDPHAIHNPMSVAELQRTAPGLDWRRYLDAMGIGSHGRLDVAQPAFMRALARGGVEPAFADWQSYLRWHAMLTYAPFLAQRFESEHFRFYRAVLEGMRAPRPRNLRVVDSIGGIFGELVMGQAIGDLYVEKAFTPQTRERILQMVERIRGVLRRRIASLDWMSDETRAEALRKLDSMRVKIGYRDQAIDDRGLAIDRETYAENVMRAAEFELDRRIARIGRPVDRGEWAMGAHVANAYYDLQMNEIVVPAGLLQPPFFDADADDTANFGAIGSIIGHEITHAFDDEGRHYDSEGNLRDWWTDEDAERYRQRTAPIVRQYARYVGDDGAPVSGRLTLGENIADIGGIKLAYLAYLDARAADRDRTNATVDGRSAEQRFFMAYAASWREKTRPERERMLISTDPHAPPRHRVQGPLAHMPEFARAFACAPSPQMAGGIW